MRRGACTVVSASRPAPSTLWRCPTSTSWPITNSTNLVFDRDRLAEIGRRQVTETINFGIKTEGKRRDER